MTACMAGLLGVLGVCLPPAVANVSSGVSDLQNAAPPLCDLQTVILDDETQGSLCLDSLRPTADGGLPTPFVLTARSRIDADQPTNPEAPGEAGTVTTGRNGAGVKTDTCHGSQGISGRGGDRDEELILTFDAPVIAADILIGVRDIEFCDDDDDDDDDPVIFVSSAGATGYDYTILEAEIEAAFTSTGSTRGYVDFGAFTSLPEDLMIDAFKLRETRDHIYLFSVELLAVCDDGLWCNGVESCDPALGCQAGAPPDCDDGINCTSDSCDEDNDQCVHTASNGVCDDGNACTDDSCDPATGCVHLDNTDPCDDGDACTTSDTCSGGACAGGSPLDCDDQSICTDDSCDPATGCVHLDNTDPCDDGDACTTSDMCADGECVGTIDPTDTDDDGAPDACDACPGRDDFRFDPGGSCPDAAFHVAVLEEASSLSCGPGRPDCADTDPPISCETDLSCGNPVFVEVWVTKFSPDVDAAPPHDPGIACAYVDLVSDVPVVAEMGFAYGAAFDAGSGFESGAFDGTGGVLDLGACSTTAGGVGNWPEWVLLARVELEQTQGEPLGFSLQESATFSTSVWGQGPADPVDFGDRCDSGIGFCDAHMYDIDEDCYVGPGDLACWPVCWLLCPEDPGYGTGACGESCDTVNYVNCDPSDCVGPEDFAFWVTCWLQHCNDPACILVPDDICGGPALIESLPPLPSDSLLESLRLEPPSADWKGYERGILDEWEQMETEQASRASRHGSRRSIGDHSGR